MNNNVKGYLLNFTIPQGPTGPQGITGPTGPSSSLNAYGGKYNSTQQTINLAIGTQTQITLPSQMPNLNVSYTPSNSLTIEQAGNYEINYFGNFSLALATTVTLAVRLNGTNIPSTIISRTFTANSNALYSGSVIVNLPAGSIIDLAISALVALSITFGSGVNASLTVKKLN